MTHRGKAKCLLFPISCAEQVIILWNNKQICLKEVIGYKENLITMLTKNYINTAVKWQKGYSKFLLLPLRKKTYFQYDFVVIFSTTYHCVIFDKHRNQL